jgi:hypothetical protein
VNTNATGGNWALKWSVLGIVPHCDTRVKTQKNISKSNFCPEWMENYLFEFDYIVSGTSSLYQKYLINSTKSNKKETVNATGISLLWTGIHLQQGISCLMLGPSKGPSCIPRVITL